VSAPTPNRTSPTTTPSAPIEWLREPSGFLLDALSRSGDIALMLHLLPEGNALIERVRMRSPIRPQSRAYEIVRKNSGAASYDGGEHAASIFALWGLTQDKGRTNEFEK